MTNAIDMKTTFKTMIYTCTAAIMLVACAGNDSDLGKIEVPGTDYTLPQGGNTEADKTIVGLYEKYGTYFLYDFTEKDFLWTLVNTSTLGDNIYRFDPIDAGDVTPFLGVIQNAWLCNYSESFLKEAMPFKVFLTEHVQRQESVFDWSAWDYILSWVDIPGRSLSNQIALTNPGKAWSEMTATEKLSLKQYWNAMFLQYCVESGSITIPDDFYALSDYTKSLAWESASTVRDAGFIYDPMSDTEWASDSYTLSKSTDLNAYIAQLVYRTDSEWDDDLTHDCVKRKYNILVQAFTDAGIDIRAIGNQTYQ